jgi:hypothetical protein
MIKLSTEGPRRTFAFEPLKPVHLEELSSWLTSIGVELSDTLDEETMRSRLHTAFRRQFRPLWCHNEMETRVMTMNRVPVFCVSLLRMRISELADKDQSLAHMYLLCRPQVRESGRLLTLAWQAATVFAFLRLGCTQVQVAVDAREPAENEALLMLGYSLVESVRESAGKMNVYVCGQEDMRIVM